MQNSTSLSYQATCHLPLQGLSLTSISRIFWGINALLWLSLLIGKKIGRRRTCRLTHSFLDNTLDHHHPLPLASPQVSTLPITFLDKIIKPCWKHVINLCAIKTLPLFEMMERAVIVWSCIKDCVLFNMHASRHAIGEEKRRRGQERRSTVLYISILCVDGWSVCCTFRVLCGLCVM